MTPINVIYIALGICAFLLLIYIACSCITLPKIKEWLLYAVTEAEKALGGGTGQIKLRYVYDMFLVKFPRIAKFISFNDFSKLVDEALDKFRNLLKNNKDINTYVNGEGEKNDS